MNDVEHIFKGLLDTCLSSFLKLPYNLFLKIQILPSFLMIQDIIIFKIVTYVFTWLCQGLVVAFGILVLQPGIKPGMPAVEV